MGKEGPFFTVESAREVALQLAAETQEARYIVTFKASFYVTDDRRQFEGDTPFFRLIEVVEP